MKKGNVVRGRVDTRLRVTTRGRRLGNTASLSSAAAAGVLAGEEEIEPNSKKPGSLIRGDLAPGDIIIITCHIPSQRKLSAHGRKVSDS